MQISKLNMDTKSLVSSRRSSAHRILIVNQSNSQFVAGSVTFSLVSVLYVKELLEPDVAVMSVLWFVNLLYE